MCNKLIKRLKRYNEWRRGGEGEQPDPTQLGEDIDKAIELLESVYIIEDCCGGEYKMDREDVEMLQYRMENEGFDYCFRCYSDFKEIDDEKFQMLRKKYCEIADELEDYVNNMVENLEEE